MRDLSEILEDLINSVNPVKEAIVLIADEAGTHQHVNEQFN